MMIGYGGDNAKKATNALITKKAERPRNELRPVEGSSKPYIKKKGDKIEAGIKVKW